MDTPAAPTVTYATLCSDPRRKSVPLAVLLSLMPGLGQVYLGLTTQGFTHAVVVGGLITALEAGPGRLEPLFGMFLSFYWLYNMVEAGRYAQAYNASLHGMAPDAVPPSDHRGTLLGGLVVMLVGLLTFVQATFHFSLAWLHHFWPLALVIIGGYLIWQHIAQRRLAMKEADAPESDLNR